VVSAWAIIAIGAAASAVYLMGGGFMYKFVHEHPKHNQSRCDDGRNMPCFLWAGIGWPLLLVLLTVYALWVTGERLEDQRPVHRKERREVERKKDLRSIS
jgi:hypothetical protein